MRTHVLAALLVLGGAVVGALLGRVLWPAEPPRDAASVPPEPTDPRRLQTPRGLVCVRDVQAYARSEPDEDAEDCAAEGLALAICEARLDECSRAKASLRHAWPETPATNEDPSAFPDVMEASLAECGLGDALEMIDCTEYPCVAALRPATRTATLDETALAELNATIDACAPLRTAFEVGPEQKEALEVYPVRVPCGDHDEIAYVLGAMNTNGAAWATWQAWDEGDNMNELLRWMYRRGDDVASLWTCDDPAP